MDYEQIWPYIFAGGVLVTVLGFARILYSSWQGTVTEIVQFMGVTNLMNRGFGHPDWTHSFTIHYITDDGTKDKITYDVESFYRRYIELKVGDQLVKTRGQWHPEMVKVRKHH